MESWFYEQQSPTMRFGLKVSDKIHEEQTKYQHLEIYQTESLGKLLVLDGCVMLTEHDEFYYHEMLVHPAMMTHPNPKKVLVLGGGDGGCIRELMKYDGIEEAILCELDERVVDLCKVHFPTISNQLSHPKVKVHIQDGFHYLKDHSKTFDILIVDSTDPIGEAKKLFEQPFYELCKAALKEDGILILQSEPIIYKQELIQEMVSYLQPLFAHCYLYTFPVPTYPSGDWSAIYASQTCHPIQNLKADRYSFKTHQTKHYHPWVHVGSFFPSDFLYQNIPSLRRPMEGFPKLVQ